MVSPTARSITAPSPAQRNTFREDVLAGLAQKHKSIPAKHIYDARGSELFERICELDEYYLTRTEAAIVERKLPEIADELGKSVTLIEPGAGSGEKAATLLRAMDEPQMYVPIEISKSALEGAVERIEAECPDVDTQPICGDFTRDANLQLDDDSRRVVYFPGSTIGNFENADRARLWQRFAQLAGDDGKALIGFDLVKSADILLPAYDDREGVTEAFNTNLLHRINRELDGDIDVDKFSYRAVWNEELQCVEMGQVSDVAQTVHVADRTFEFSRGEFMRTERSHKFTPERMDAEAAAAGFEREAYWMDKRHWFCVGLFQLR